jgi:hypothetical protein
MLRKVSMRVVLRYLGAPSAPLLRHLNHMLATRQRGWFQRIRSYGENKRARRQMVSSRVKGKVLCSIRTTGGPKPLDLRKAFLSWYLKGHEQKYAKMIYNIWLNGHISTFTFLMRIKNMIH